MVPPEGVYLPISKLHSNLAVANLLAHNNKVKFVIAVKFHYRVLQLTAVFLTPLLVPFILLATIISHKDSVLAGFRAIVFPNKVSNGTGYLLLCGTDWWGYHLFCWQLLFANKGSNGSDWTQQPAPDTPAVMSSMRQQSNEPTSKPFAIH